MNVYPVPYSLNIKSSTSPQEASRQNSLERTPARDTVSFSGKIEPRKNNNQIASDLGVQIYNQSLKKHMGIDEISQIINSETNNLTIKPIEDLQEEISDYQNYEAYFISQTNPNFTTSNHEMYINTNKPRPSKTEKLLLAMNVGHEYTHFLQNNTITSKLEDICNGDYEYAKIVQFLGIETFKKFDTTIQAQAVISTMMDNPETRLSFQKYGCVVPQKQQINKQNIFKSLNLSNEKEFNNYIQNAYEEEFLSILGKAIENPDILNLILPYITNENGDVDESKIMKLLQDSQKYCVLTSDSEKEAYKTESDIAKRILNTPSVLNIDIFPMYYSLLENALDK